MGKAVRRTSLLCSLPEDAISSCARVTIIGRGVVLVEGQRGVVELGDTSVRLRTAHGILIIRGEALQLQELSFDSAMICGESIESAGYA